MEKMVQEGMEYGKNLTFSLPSVIKTAENFSEAESMDSNLWELMKRAWMADCYPQHGIGLSLLTSRNDWRP